MSHVFLMCHQISFSFSPFTHVGHVCFHSVTHMQVARFSHELHASQQELKNLAESHKKALQEHCKAQSAVQSTESELYDLRLAFTDLKVPCCCSRTHATTSCAHRRHQLSRFALWPPPSVPSLCICTVNFLVEGASYGHGLTPVLRP